MDVPVDWVFAAEGAAAACGSSSGASSGGAAAAGGAGGGGGALYFAQAPPLHVERYCAVLTSRPPGPVYEARRRLLVYSQRRMYKNRLHSSVVSFHRQYKKRVVHLSEALRCEVVS